MTEAEDFENTLEQHGFSFADVLLSLDTARFLRIGDRQSSPVNDAHPPRVRLPLFPTSAQLDTMFQFLNVGVEPTQELFDELMAATPSQRAAAFTVAYLAWVSGRSAGSQSDGGSSGISSPAACRNPDSTPSQYPIWYARLMASFSGVFGRVTSGVSNTQASRIPRLNCLTRSIAVAICSLVITAVLLARGRSLARAEAAR